GALPDGARRHRAMLDDFQRLQPPPVVAYGAGSGLDGLPGERPAAESVVTEADGSPSSVEHAGLAARLQLEREKANGVGADVDGAEAHGAWKGALGHEISIDAR